VLAFSFISAVFSLPFAIMNYQVPNFREWILLASIGVLSVVGQGLMTKAYALGSPTPVSIASYSVVLFSALWGYIFFNEIQDLQAMIGSVLVIGSLLFLPLLSSKTGIRIRHSTGPVNTSSQ